MKQFSEQTAIYNCRWKLGIAWVYCSRTRTVVVEPYTYATVEVVLPYLVSKLRQFQVRTLEFSIEGR